MGPLFSELHAHTNFSFLDGGSPVEDLVARALELGLDGLAATDHQGLYGAVRFVGAAQEAGLRPIVGLEVELLDPVMPDPDGIVVPHRRRGHPRRASGPTVAAWPTEPIGSDGVVARSGSVAAPASGSGSVAEGRPIRPTVERQRPPGHREPRREELRRVRDRERGPHLVLLARDLIGYRSLCRLASAAHLAGSKGVPRFTQGLLAEHTEGLVALSGCRHGEIARRLLAGDRAGAEAVARRYAERYATVPGIGGGFFLELQHHLLPDDDFLVAETAGLAARLGLPVVVTNDAHYARPEDRELADVLVAIRHGLTLDESAHLRRPNGESHLKSSGELAALPPGPAVPAWAEGLRTAGELGARCDIDLGFERYRFPGFAVPRGETPFSHLERLCHEGARQRYQPMTPAVVKQLAHELEVIERTGLAEFFLICWDLMRFARERGIPAQGRGSAGDSIVAYVLGITRVDPIRHRLLFERFINEGRTAYPDVDIDFASSRREEVIQYVYERYGEAHTGMVCNVVTYRARSAVREVGYALGFPRPLVDRVAKALETYDSVMVRRDLEADGGFAEFFRVPGEGPDAAVLAGTATAPGWTAAASAAGERGLVDRMGQLAYARGVPGGPGSGGRGSRPVGQGEPSAVGQGEPSAVGQGERSSRVARRTSRSGEKEPRRPPRGGGPKPIGDILPVMRREGSVEASSMWEREHALDTRDGPDAPVPDPLASSPERLAPVVALRRGPSDDEGGPGDSPASVRWLRAGGRPWPGAGGGPWPGAGGGPWPGAGQQRAEALTAASAAMSAPISLVPIRQGRTGAPETGARARPGIDGRRDTAGERESDTPRASSELLITSAGRIDATSQSGNTPSDISSDKAEETPSSNSSREDRDDSAASVERTPPGTIDGREIDPETGALLPPPRRTDRLGRPFPWDPPSPPVQAMGRGGADRRTGRGGADPGGGRGGAAGPGIGGRGATHDPGHSSVARLEPEPPPQPRGGSTAGLSPWERWLELCARIDGFPRHLGIHVGGMLITRAPLVDIAPLERASMPGRVVVQYDKRDVETMKLIKLDLLGLRMLSAIDDALRDIQADCGVCLDLDRLPEDVPQVFAMIQAADTVGVFQIESRAQMQTLPKSRPETLDDLVVEVAIIRPGPIQGNAVHPYLRRRQGLEPVSYLHPSLEPVLAETLGVILYQEQVMRIAIEVAGFSAAESDGFRRAMGTWRSSREMEKLHRRFVEGCMTANGLPKDDAEELYRQVAGFASFGFNKSHAAAFARTAYESAFLKLAYPAQFTAGLINAQPMGFYPVEVLVNDAKRHGVAVLPVDLDRSRYRTTTEWVGMPGEPLPAGAGIERRPEIVRSPACVVLERHERGWLAAESAEGYGIRLGLHLVNGIGEELGERLERERERGPYRSLADVVARTGLSEEVLERLIRAGALDSLGRPRRELLWQLHEVAGATKGRPIAGPAASRPLDLRLPATEAPDLPPPSELERLGDSYAILSLDARRQVIELFRPALQRLGAVTAAELAERRPGRVAIGGLVVTRQHPMTAKGTVFLALEDETGMVNVTLWPKAWERLRSVVRRHALLYVKGTLQREAEVVNLVAREIVSLPDLARGVGGPSRPEGVRQLGHAGMRRLG